MLKALSEAVPATKAELKQAALYRSNGVEVDTFSDVYKILEEFKPGDKIEISYYPPNAELTTDEVVANVTLQENK